MKNRIFAIFRNMKIGSFEMCKYEKSDHSNPLKLAEISWGLISGTPSRPSVGLPRLGHHGMICEVEKLKEIIISNGKTENPSKPSVRLSLLPGRGLFSFEDHHPPRKNLMVSKHQKTEQTQQSWKWKRRAPKNDRETSERFLKILNMKSRYWKMKRTSTYLSTELGLLLPSFPKWFYTKQTSHNRTATLMNRKCLRECPTPRVPQVPSCPPREGLCGNGSRYVEG